MSVRMGTPSSRLTLARISSPRSMPGPRKVLPLERLALSKLLLKMNGMPKEVVISFNVPAVSICSCSDSMTQGPAIRNRGWFRPTSKPHSFISGHRFQCFACGLMVQRRLDEGNEQRVSGPRCRVELGVKLHAHEPGVHALRQFHNFRQMLALGESGNHQARFAQRVQKMH